MNKLHKLTVVAFLALNCLAFFGATLPKVNEYEGQHRAILTLNEADDVFSFGGGGGAGKVSMQD